MKVQLHQTAQVFDALAAEWQHLAQVSPRADLFFMQPGFQKLWWQHLARGTLHVLSFHDDGNRLIGVLPCFLEDEPDGTAALKLIGSLDAVDYLDAVFQPGLEGQLWSAALNYLQSTAEVKWDALVLDNIPAASPTRGILADLADPCGLSLSEQQAEVCPTLSLPPDYEAYLESLDKKQRHELRRKRRRAEENEVTHQTALNDPQLEDHITAFLTLMAESSSEKAAFLEQPGNAPFMRDVIQWAYSQESCRLMFLNVSGTSAAAMLHFAWKGRMMLYNSGLHPSEKFASLSTGIVLVTYAIEEAIAQGCTAYDFLRGDETYKLRMGATPEPIYALHLRRQGDQ